MKTKRYPLNIFILLLLVIHPLAAINTQETYQVQAYPNSFNVFRDSVYLQNREILEIMRLYAAAKQDIEKSFTGADMYMALSHCEYLIGITFRAAGRNNEAAAFFEQGIAHAEESIQIRPTSEGYRYLGTNISFLCEIRTSYGLKNNGKIEWAANKALELDPNNLMAKHLTASFYLLAPWPLSNVKKGAAILEEITKQNYLAMDKENQFNLYLMLQLACLKQKKNQEAQAWREKGAAIYPNNNFIALLMD